MDGTTAPLTKSAAAKLVKRNFLEALKSNDSGKLKAILIQRQIDVDTVFEVEDENMVLASYKQGKKLAVIVTLIENGFFFANAQWQSLALNQ